LFYRQFNGTITASPFGHSMRTARTLLAACVMRGFLDIADPANKSCRYRLSEKHRRVKTSFSAVC
jgi:DNA-binding transcriptional regulator PaaX